MRPATDYELTTGKSANMNTLFLVRHGENRANLTKEFSYKTVDYSLTPKGVLQAQQTAEFFQDRKIDEVYASPLRRARETAEIIAHALKLDVTIVEDFREVNVGALDGQASAESWAYHDQIVNDWFESRHDSMFDGGEDYWALLARMRQGLHRIVERKSDRTIVVVGHGGLFTFTIKDICQNVDLQTIRHRVSPNCSIAEIGLSAHDGALRGELRSWGVCAHLSGEAAQLISGHFSLE
jgi:broad specificity phosphatase PhoE